LRVLFAESVLAVNQGAFASGSRRQAEKKQDTRRAYFRGEGIGNLRNPACFFLRLTSA